MSAKFFIERPRFAVVISLVLIIAGSICAYSLLVGQYPEVAPSQVNIWTPYQSADAETAAIPIEEAVNGVDGTLYMSSSANNKGYYDLAVTFSNLLAFIALTSPNATKDELFLTNYANNNVKNMLYRIHGMGKIQVIGASYTVRIWLDHERLSSLGLSAQDVITAVEEQNKQSALGSLGASPSYNSASHEVLSIIAKGRFSDISEFEEIVLKYN